MNTEQLQHTARKLRQPDAPAAATFEACRESLAEELSRRMMVRPDIEKLIGPGNLPMMQDNSRNFCRFMSTMFRGYEPDVLVQTVLWVFRAYRSHGFQPTYWAANLDTFVEILRERIAPASFQSLYPFFQWLIVNIPIFVTITDGQMSLASEEPPSHACDNAPRSNACNRQSGQTSLTPAEGQARL